MVHYILGPSKSYFIKLLWGTEMHEKVTRFILQNRGWKFSPPTFFIHHALFLAEIILSHWSSICLDDMIMHLPAISLLLTTCIIAFFFQLIYFFIFHVFFPNPTNILECKKGIFHSTKQPNPSNQKRVCYPSRHNY